MTLHFAVPDWAVPDWVPWWGQLAALVLVALFALAFLLMPFSVFGVKGRLDAIEARLDEIQGEVRALSLRLPEPMGLRDFNSDGVGADENPYSTSVRPSIPPAARDPQGGSSRARHPFAARPRRDEPRLD